MTYKEFIDNLLNTRPRFLKDAKPYKYVERHHIVPRCLGGKDTEDNLIDLYIDEHLLAHELLAIANMENKPIQDAYRYMVVMKDKREKWAKLCEAKHNGLIPKGVFDIDAISDKYD